MNNTALVSKAMELKKELRECIDKRHEFTDDEWLELAAVNFMINDIIEIDKAERRIKELKANIYYGR